MTDVTRARPITINRLFAAAADLPPAEIAEFVMFCIDRVQHLIETSAARDACQQLRTSGTVSPEVAQKAATFTSDMLSLQHLDALNAVSYAVAHCVPEDSMYFGSDRKENARHVALCCQWAVGKAECPSDDDDECEHDEYVSDTGYDWLYRQITDREQAYQLAFVFKRFPHWLGPVTNKDA